MTAPWDVVPNLLITKKVEWVAANFNDMHAGLDGFLLCHSTTYPALLITEK